MAVTDPMDRDTHLALAPVPGLIQAMAPHVPILDALDEGAYIVDRNRQIVYWNSSAERITGFSQGEVLGRGCGEGILNHVDETGACLCQAMCPLMKVMATCSERSASVYFHHKRGHRIPTTVHGLPLSDANGAMVGAIELFTDTIGKQALAERIAELESMAYLDSLTRLPNRRFVADMLGRRLAECRRSGVTIGVAILDIDHFKKFNDTLGHAAGDEMLKIVGRTLSSVARKADIIGRWGGEEFVGIFPNASWESLHGALERLRGLVSATWLEWNDAKVSATVSIGATLSTPDDSPESIVQRADSLLYKSKGEGRDRVSTDGPAMAA